MPLILPLPSPARCPLGAHVYFPEVEWVPHPPPTLPPGPGPAPAPAPAPGIDATAALSELAQAYADAERHARSRAWTRHLWPTPASLFWTAVTLWLGFQLARAEGLI